MDCERCGLYFEEKKHLIQHLRKKKECMPIFSDESRELIINKLSKIRNLNKTDFKCIHCNHYYKTSFNLKRHQTKCNSISSNIIQPNNAELMEKIKELTDKINSIIEKPYTQNIKNITNNIENIQNNTQNINITINSLNDTSGKQIQHILNSPFFKENLLEWVKSKDGLFKYIDYKFFNPEHPENQMIKPGDNKEHIDLHIYGKWKKYENDKASDIILTNVGVDFDSYFGVLKYENEEDYRKNKKAILKFKDNVIEPLEWGTDISEDEEIIYKGRIEKRGNELVYIDEDRENHIQNYSNLSNKLIQHIHSK